MNKSWNCYELLNKFILITYNLKVFTHNKNG